MDQEAMTAIKAVMGRFKGVRTMMSEFIGKRGHGFGGGKKKRRQYDHELPDYKHHSMHVLFAHKLGQRFTACSRNPHGTTDRGGLLFHRYAAGTLDQLMWLIDQGPHHAGTPGGNPYTEASA